MKSESSHFPRAGCRTEVTEEGAAAAAEVVFAPLLRQLSDRSVDQEILLRQGKQVQQQQQQYSGGGVAPSVGAAAVAAAAASAAAGPAAIAGDHAGGAGGVAGAAADGGLEGARINVERQILLTTLLAHMCASNDATPRTFVEQVGARKNAKNIAIFTQQRYSC